VARASVCIVPRSSPKIESERFVARRKDREALGNETEYCTRHAKEMYVHLRDEQLICLVELVDANRMTGKGWLLVGRTLIGRRTIAPSLLQFAHSGPPGCRSSQQCSTPLPSSPSPRCCPSCGGFEGAIESRSQAHPLVHLRRDA
jgi:hypothetical protein